MSYTSSTLYFSDNTSNTINTILPHTLTNTDVITSAIHMTPPHIITDICGVVIGTNITKLNDEVFSGCLNLNSITINNTDNLTYIGNNIFGNNIFDNDILNDICGNGVYKFYSRNYYYTSTISQLINLLPKNISTGQTEWISGLDQSYNYYTEFSVLYNDLTLIDIIDCNIQHYYLKPIDISYQEFHNLFFSTNNYLTLNKYYINDNNYNRYTIINKQIESIYNSGDLIYDISFNLFAKVLSHYQHYIPKQLWSLESSICFNKKISNIKYIFDFKTTIKINNKCECGGYNGCFKNCKPPYQITIDDFFNMFEAQGVEMATDNSFNSIPKSAIGLPIDSDSNKRYIAVLSLYLKSNNITVPNICIKMPYAISFQDSMPKTAVIPNMNNYRYNPDYTGP